MSGRRVEETRIGATGDSMVTSKSMSTYLIALSMRVSG